MGRSGLGFSFSMFLPFLFSIFYLVSAKKREKLFDEINEVADVGIGIISHRTIDKINILQATFKAMRQAINKLEEPPHKSLIDGFGFPDQKLKNEGIIDGDNKVESISAASIIAKVTRDGMMKDIDPIFPEYGFSKHKGYGTQYHMNALRELKATPIHRHMKENKYAHLPYLSLKGYPTLDRYLN